MTQQLLGAHVSTAGGVPQAPPRAKAIAATAMQIFTKQANRWAERDCADDECRAYATALAEASVDGAATVAHDSYLINLASPDPALRARSVDAFAAELRRCEALGIACLVSHPGNYMDEREAGIARNADGIAEALERVPGRTVLCLETTAGAGTVIGATFEELAALMARLPAALQPRVGVCLDTCHVYSAGYDLVQDYDAVWARFDDAIGLERLRVLHLNDSKAPFGSRKDRHELIGEGPRRRAAAPRLRTARGTRATRSGRGCARST
jgi:deoxyribonuclease-4